MSVRRLIKKTGFLFLLMVLIRADLVLAVDKEKYRLCEIELDRLEKKELSNASMKKEWLKLRSKCEGTGLYEYRLAKLYIFERDYDSAFKEIEKGVRLESPYEKELQLARGDIYLHQREFGKAEKEYREVIKKYPSWNIGYSYLGFSLFAQNKNTEALVYLKKANEIEEYWDTYRNLTLVYYLLEDYEMAVDSLNRAFSLNSSIIVDRDPMVAGIRSYAELGKFEVARKMLAMMLDKNPEFRNDNEYLRAGFFVKQKMIDAGLIEE